MTVLQKIIGNIFPPYKHKIQQKELTLLVDSLINSLPNDYIELKEQRRKTNLFHLSDWTLFPGFKFLSIGYPGTTLRDFKKRGLNYRISGQKIFSRRNRDYADVEFLIQENCLSGLRIANSNYDLEEFDLSKIKIEDIKQIPVDFPPSEIDLFYEGLEAQFKNRIHPDELIDIEFGNRTYYAFYDLGDGNYLATDKKLTVFSLVHDARPIAKKLKYSLADILDQIETKAFDKEKHLEERYKSSK